MVNLLGLCFIGMAGYDVFAKYPILGKKFLF